MEMRNPKVEGLTPRQIVAELDKYIIGQEMAKKMGVPFLGRIPIDPQIAASCDNGMPHVTACEDSPSAKAFADVVRPLQQAKDDHE